MTNDDKQPTTEATRPAKARREASVLFCPTCHAHLLTCRATIDLEIEIKCHACSRRERRGAYHRFMIRRTPAQPT